MGDEKIMVKFNHAAHVALWDWLAKHPDPDKENWPGWDINGGKYKHNVYECFACTYVVENGGTCQSHCPLLWPTKTCGELLGMWKQPKPWESRRRLAEQIRDLPVKAGVECE